MGEINVETQQQFRYEVFDRQLLTMQKMCEVLYDGWEDYGTQEMTFDIRSLCAKVVRLCRMCDDDYAIQQNDLLHQRSGDNERYLQMVRMLLQQKLTPILLDVIYKHEHGQEIKGQKMQPLPTAVTPMMESIRVFFEGSENGIALLTELVTSTNLLDKEIEKKGGLTKFPGVKPYERIWNLLQLYTMMCYLIVHFERVCALTSEQGNEDAQEMLERSVKQYLDSTEGREAVEHYFDTLKYDNNNEPLSADQLRQARKELDKYVPISFHHTYINCINDRKALAESIRTQELSADDFCTVLHVLACSDRLSYMIHRLEEPESEKQHIYNEVFVLEKEGKPIDLRALRTRMLPMVDMVDKKNHWFCVWCVVRHHGLLNSNIPNFEAFARQMMHKDWFGGYHDGLHIEGDNLREYSGYFTMSDYTLWDEKSYHLYCAKQSKNKWGKSLCMKFQRLCYEMDEAFTHFAQR